MFRCRLMPIVFGILILNACSTTRKLSRVGLREPASVANTQEEASSLRTKFSTIKKFAEECPEEWQERLQRLVLEKIVMPRCPKDFEEAVPIAENFLKIEERSLMEEIYSSQCASIARNQLEEQLQNFADSFESSGPLGRITATAENSADVTVAAQPLEKLRSGFRAIFNSNLPLEKWIVVNGEYLLSEGDLRILDEVIVKRACVLDDYGLEDIYQSIHNIDDLIRMMNNSDQSKELQEVLQGMHKLVDTKVTEYFKP